tara:strand:- start:18 stop:1019 length:1002 start_codon:yes stop_codon:yes gene_type:complete
MILVEPSSINLVTYSEDFSDISYEKTRVAITTDDSISPDGTTSADKLNATATTGTHFLKINRTVTSGAAYTFSVFVKKGEYDWVNVMLQGTGWTNSTKSINFNASTGEFGTVTFGVTHTSERLANGWYRLSITNTTVSTTVAVRLYGSAGDNVLSYQGDGTSGVYIWGAQLEESSVATSYIPTSGSTVTRAADDLVISGSAFDFYNQSEGTFYGEIIINANPYDSYPVMVHAGASTDYIRLSTAGQYRVRNASVTQTNRTIGTFAIGSVSRFAFSYKQNDFVGTIDGSSESIGTSGSIPSVNQLTIGSFLNTANYLNGRIRRLIFWPTHSDNL